VFQDASPFPGLANWCINLSGPASGVAVSDAGGNYTFTGLPAGTYTVCEVIQSGWRQTYPPASQGGATCPAGFGYSFTLGDGAGTMFIDFGNVTP
jgi:hypothetical protein